MGLSIHYGLKTNLDEKADIRRLVETVRQFALDLPLASVGEIVEFAADDYEPPAEAATGLADVEVHDDGDYWKRRDLEALAREIGRCNELIVGFAGGLRDALGPIVEATITDFADFEHLEAKGLERLSDLRREKE